MEKIRLFFLVGIIALGLAACDLDDDDGYSLSNQWIGFGLSEKTDSHSNSFKMNMDDGTVIYPIVNNEPWLNVENNQRYLVNFTILGDRNTTSGKDEFYVRINKLDKILYKGIFNMTPAKEDSIGNDPIHVADAWVSKNMLNFELHYYADNKTHFINLVRPTGTSGNTTEPIVLELRHNDNGDSQYIPAVSYVSFNLDALKQSGKTSVAFKVTGKEPNGTAFTYNGVFKYTQN